MKNRKKIKIMIFIVSQQLISYIYETEIENRKNYFLFIRKAENSNHHNICYNTIVLVVISVVLLVRS